MTEQFDKDLEALLSDNYDNHSESNKWLDIRNRIRSEIDSIPKAITGAVTSGYEEGYRKACEDYKIDRIGKNEW